VRCNEFISASKSCMWSKPLTMVKTWKGSSLEHVKGDINILQILALFSFSFLGGGRGDVGDQNQSLVHAKQVLCHRANPQTHEKYSVKPQSLPQMGGHPDQLLWFTFSLQFTSEILIFPVVWNYIHVFSLQLSFLFGCQLWEDSSNNRGS
jgi:hypothetical protein